MKLAILDAHADNPGDLSWRPFEEFAEVFLYDRTNQNEIISRAKDCEAIFVNKVRITEEILENLPKLKYIGVCATGYNVIDLKACSKRGIIVTNIPGYSAAAVAQHVFSFILHFSNHVALHNESVHAGEWCDSLDFVYWKKPLTELAGKTLGIFGYGSIGEKVAAAGKIFGMNVIYNSRSKKNADAEFVSFDELLKRSDILSLHAPLTEETKHIIDKNSLAKMKKTALLINTARGDLVVEKDVAECLKNGGIAGFAADVASVEPMEKNNPLLRCPNCVLTPHIAWAPKETRQRLLNIALDNFKAWINGKPINKVN